MSSLTNFVFGGTHYYKTVMTPGEGLVGGNEKRAVKRGIWVPTQHLL